MLGDPRGGSRCQRRSPIGGGGPRGEGSSQFAKENGWKGEKTEKTKTHLFQIREDAILVRLASQYVIAPVADGRRGIELFLFFERQRKKGGRGVKDGCLQRAGHTVVDDLKEASADAGGTHTRDNIRRRGGMRVRQKRGDVNGWHVKFIGGRAPGGGVPPGP